MAYSNTGPVTISLWQQVDDLVNNGIYGNDTVDSILRVDENGSVYTTTTHTSASDGSINKFINRWGLSVSEDQDSSLGFPVNMPKHVVLTDGRDPDQHAPWGSLTTNLPNRVLVSMSVEIDVSITTKIPYNPLAPAPGAQN